MYAECALYYGGRQITPTLLTPLVQRAKAASPRGWAASWLSFGMPVRNIPRETLLCFSVYTVTLPSSTGVAEAASQLEACAQLRTLKASTTAAPTAATVRSAEKVYAQLERKPLLWTSVRLYDHCARLLTGARALPMLRGPANPVGICVQAMGLRESETAALLDVQFPGAGLTVLHAESDALATLERRHQTSDSSSDSTSSKDEGTSASASLAAAARRKKPAAALTSSATLRSGSGSVGTPTEVAKVMRIAQKDALYVLTEEEKQLVWRLRYSVRCNHPDSLAKVMQAVPWTEPAAAAEAHRLLEHWPPMDPLLALELLDSKYPDAKVRAYAVGCLERLGTNDLEEWMMQLVQALKCEAYHNSPLARFLLARALNDRARLGHTFFWMLQAEMHIQEVRERFRLLTQFYLRGSGEHRDVLARQLDLVDRLVDANRSKSLGALPPTCVGERLPLPHDPALRVSALDVEHCRVLDSARAPLWLAFRNADPLVREPVCVLFKATDDLRQDMLALQVLRVMNTEWEHEGLDMRVTYYRCVALGPEIGMIEIVPDCTTIADIQKTSGGGGVTSAFKERTIAEWLSKKNPDPAAHQAAVDNFLHSCAAYCVATYLLGVGDRHNDNIMLTRTGDLFHIDFGHILGNAEKWKGFKRDRAPFVLTPEFVFVMGGKDSDNFRRFCEVACRAYVLIRGKNQTFVNLFSMMLHTDIPEIRSEDDLAYLQAAFHLDMSEAEAYDVFAKLIAQSLGTVMTRINNAIHIAAHPHINDAHQV